MNNIEELIAFCENGADWYNRIGPTADKFAQIAEVLRAGQKMRDAQITGIQGDIFLAVKAWDAATKGDV